MKNEFITNSIKYYISEMESADNKYRIYGVNSLERKLLFQSASLDEVNAFMDENRLCTVLKPDNETEDLSNVEGYSLIDYYRLYFRDGWYGRWMTMDNLPEHKPTTEEAEGINNIINFLIKHFPNGCDYEMMQWLRRYENWGVDKDRYLLVPNKYYKICIQTTYGNSDYPVRIYAYREK